MRGRFRLWYTYNIAFIIMYLNSIIIYYKKTPCAPGHEWCTKKKKKITK